MNIYHRIYKLHQRKVPAQQIAATTHMPIKSVREIIKRLENKAKDIPDTTVVPDIDPYLDVIITKTNKYTLIDFSGFFVGQFTPQIKSAISEVRQQLGLTLAIKMDEVFQIDQEGFAPLTQINKELKIVGKTLVILSPSPEVEKYIDDNNIESQMTVFGTLRAFEEHAFKASHSK